MKISVHKLRSLIREALDESDPLRRNNFTKIEMRHPEKNWAGTYELSEVDHSEPGETPAGFAKRLGMTIVSREDYDGQDITQRYIWRLKKGGDEFYVMTTSIDLPRTDEELLKFGQANQKFNSTYFKISHELVRKYSSEVKRVAQPEAPEGSVLGRYAFASGNKRPDAPDEDDTPEEEKLYSDILSIINGAVGHIDKDDVKIYRRALEAGYDEMIGKVTSKRTAKSIKNVYRGMAVTEEWIKNFIGQDEPLPDTGSVEGSFVFLPNTKGGSSWSWDKGIAESSGYQEPGLEEKGLIFHVVLTADGSIDGPNDFIHITNAMYGIMKYEYGNERESIGVGDVQVKKVEWRRQSTKQ